MRHEITQEEITKAICVIKSVSIADRTTHVIPSTFVGYVAAFGAAITLTGVLPAVVLYGNEAANTQDKRDKVVTAIEKLLDIKFDEKIKTLTGHLLSLSTNKLLEEEERIIHQAIVLKLALRTFRTEDKSLTSQSDAP